MVRDNTSLKDSDVGDRPRIPAAAIAMLRQRPGVASTVADALAEMILNHDLAPGTRLVQAEVMEWFNVSRIAVRDALSMLAKTGLAVEGHGRSMFVQDVSTESIRQILEVRVALEVLAARKACQRMSDRDFENLRVVLVEQEQIIRDGQTDRFPSVERRFHELIYEHADNRVLVELLGPLELRFRQAVSLAQIHSEGEVNGLAWVQESLTRHRRIVEALRTRNGDLAAEVVSQCLNEASMRLLTMLAPVAGSPTATINPTDPPSAPR